uniref:Caspase family p10 domain-containing protein n=1 Tax=Globodera rostochiensis TaxID=31243 RepID=A0A914I9K3_GLORO
MRSKRRRHCIDGTCHKAGCDHRLGSEMNSRRLRCLCTFGYNEVLRIPAGAAGIDITQTAHNGQKEDDNYLALRTFTGEFLLNGQYQVPLFRQQIPILDTVLEYSGSDCGGVDKRHRTIAFRHLPSRVSVRCARECRAPTDKLRRLPTDADFLICCSTTDYRVSWRSRLRGSRFIQAICECFARYAAVDDVLHLMTRYIGQSIDSAQRP